MTANWSRNGHAVGFSKEMALRDCPWCGLKHAQMNVAFHNSVAQHLQPGKPVRTYSLLTCPECAGPIVIETPDPQGASEVLRTVPEDPNVVEIRHLPPDVERFYLGAVRIMRAGEPEAAAVQLRRTIESAVTKFEIEPFPLVKAVKQLIQQNFITKQFGEALDHVRRLGNLGAHAGDEILGEDEVRAALDFTTQLLRNLFEIPGDLALMLAGDADAEEETGAEA